MSPTTELIGHLATGTLSAVVGGGIVLLVTWDRQVGIARAEYRMNRAERQSEELLRAALVVSDAVQPRALESAPVDDAMTGELLAVDGVDTEDDAPAGDTDRAGMWRVLLGLVSDLVDRAHDWLPGLVRQWQERDKIGSGEQATADDPFAELLTHVQPVEPQPVRIVRVNRYRDPGMTGQFPYVKVAGAPRHAAPEPEMPAINVPLQRDGGDDL